MALRWVVDPEPSHGLREAIVALWTTVANAGGPVGFLAPVTAEQVCVTADIELAAASSGPDRLLVGYRGDDVDDGDDLVAMAFLADNRFELMDHWYTLKRVMVHPDAQGRGYGVDLINAAGQITRAAGREALRITARSGHGLERFYERCGFIEVGRLPGAIRVGPGDDRDDVHMWLALN